MRTEKVWEHNQQKSTAIEPPLSLKDDMRNPFLSLGPASVPSMWPSVPSNAGFKLS
jgi:hypothetical protein